MATRRASAGTLLDELAVTVDVERLTISRWPAAAVDHVKRCPGGSGGRAWAEVLPATIHAFRGDLVSLNGAHIVLRA
jgi:hypothetical protein